MALDELVRLLNAHKSAQQQSVSRCGLLPLPNPPSIAVYVGLPLPAPLGLANSTSCDARG